MKVLIFHAGALGDLINTLPAIAAIRRKCAGAEITAVGNASWLPLLKEARVIDEAMALDGARFHALFNDAPLPVELRDFIGRFDMAVSWMRSPVLLGHLKGAGIRTVWLKEEFPPSPGAGHVTKVMAGPARELGIEEVSEFPRLVLPDDVLARGPKFPGILVHPGSGSARKNWPVEKFAQAATELGELSGLSIASLAGPADEEPEAALVQAMGPRLSARFKDLTSIELAALLKSSRLLIGNDSGVSHLASALGMAVVAVFTATDQAIWGVRQARARNLGPGEVETGEVVEAGMELLRGEEKKGKD